MQKIKKIVAISSLSILWALTSYTVGYIVCKRKNTPKKLLGNIFIDYTEDEKHPSIYLSNVDPIIFSEKSGYIVLGLNHIRK